jgi:ABC-2 type transport system permease protein
MKDGLRMLGLEWRLLRADAAAWVAVLLFAAALSYSYFNGYVRWGRQHAGTDNLTRQWEENRVQKQQRLQWISGAPAGAVTHTELDWGPRQPQWAAVWVGATAILPPAPLGWLLIGRSDVQPSVHIATVWRGTEPTVPTTENPVKLLIGPFDPAFVLLYLFPLLILGLTFNLVATEREDGTLRLLLSQPVSLRALLLRRAVVRGAVIGAAGIVIGGVSLAATHPVQGEASVLRLAMCLAGVALYGLFWMGLAFWVNVWGRSPAANALVVFGAWIALALVIPALAAVTSTFLFPVPSRAGFIDFERATRLELYNATPTPEEKEARDAALLAALFSRHPELRNTAGLNRGRLLNAAQGEEHELRLAALERQFQEQRIRQRALVRAFGILSPTMLLEDGLTALSGNSDERHDDYLFQAESFFHDSKRFFWPLIFRGTLFNAVDYDRIPRFVYREEPLRSVTARALLPLGALTAAALCMAAFAWFRGRATL